MLSASRGLAHRSAAVAQPHAHAPLGACRRQLGSLPIRLEPIRYKPNDSKEGSPPAQGRKPCLIQIEGKRTSHVKISKHSNPDANLQSYMEHAADHFATIPLPLGGKLKKIDDQHMEMTVPKMEVFDVWLQPRALTKITVVQNKAEITSHTADCILEGSRHVSAMNLNDRFELDVKIIFSWDEKQQKENAIHVDGSLKVEVDVPGPFAKMPKAILRAAGNTALSTVLAVIANSFLAKLSKDYHSWAESVPVKGQ